MKKNTLITDDKNIRVPRHVAVIMDGNGRWAKSRFMPRSFGHSQGIERMVDLMEHALDIGVEYITVYALSTENLNRPQKELDFLFNLLCERMPAYVRRICARGVHFRPIGDLSLLPERAQEVLRKADEETSCYKGKAINFAVAYGARAEIVRAVNTAIEKGEKVTEESFSSFLYTGGQPEVDLIIRTGKEVRLSNFLLYQAAYAELYFTDKMFPEFTEKEFDKAVLEYSNRTRRFGKTDEQVEEKEE